MAEEAYVLASYPASVEPGLISVPNAGIVWRRNRAGRKQYDRACVVTPGLGIWIFDLTDQTPLSSLSTPTNFYLASKSAVVSYSFPIWDESGQAQSTSTSRRYVVMSCISKKGSQESPYLKLWTESERKDGSTDDDGQTVDVQLPMKIVALEHLSAPVAGSLKTHFVLALTEQGILQLGDVAQSSWDIVMSIPGSDEKNYTQFSSARLFPVGLNAALQEGWLSFPASGVSGAELAQVVLVFALRQMRSQALVDVFAIDVKDFQHGSRVASFSLDGEQCVVSETGIMTVLNAGHLKSYRLHMHISNQSFEQFQSMPSVRMEPLAPLQDLDLVRASALEITPLYDSFVAVTAVHADQAAAPQLVTTFWDMRLGGILGESRVGLMSDFSQKQPPSVSLGVYPLSRSQLALTVGTSYEDTSKNRALTYIVPVDLPAKSSLSTVVGKHTLVAHHLQNGNAPSSSVSLTLPWPSESPEADYSEMLAEFKDLVHTPTISQCQRADELFFQWLNPSSNAHYSSKYDSAEFSSAHWTSYVKSAGHFLASSEGQKKGVPPALAREIASCVFQKYRRRPYPAATVAHLIKTHALGNNLVAVGINLCDYFIECRDFGNLCRIIQYAGDITEQDAVRALSTVHKIHGAPFDKVLRTVVQTSFTPSVMTRALQAQLSGDQAVAMLNKITRFLLRSQDVGSLYKTHLIQFIQRIFDAHFVALVLSEDAHGSLKSLSRYVSYNITADNALPSIVQVLRTAQHQHQGSAKSGSRRSGSAVPLTREEVGPRSARSQQAIDTQNEVSVYAVEKMWL